MRALINLALFALLPAMTACSGDSKEDSKVTQTRMDDIDSIEGTINDDMIDTTNSNTQDTSAESPDSKSIKEDGKVSETTSNTEIDAKATENDASE